MNVSYYHVLSYTSLRVYFPCCPDSNRTLEDDLDQPETCVSGVNNRSLDELDTLYSQYYECLYNYD